MYNSEFSIQWHRSAGNLHISLSGKFSGLCAWELFKIIRQRSTDTGRVFVSTASIDRVESDGQTLFKVQMTRKRMPTDWLYFKGKLGFQIAPDGSRVLINTKRPACKRSPLNIPNRDLGVIRPHPKTSQTTIPARRRR